MPDFGWFVSESLDEIRLCAGGNVTILRQMLRMLGRVAARTRNPARREALTTHARLVVEMADHTVPAAYDRTRLNGEIARLREALAAGRGRAPGDVGGGARRRRGANGDQSTAAYPACRSR